MDPERDLITSIGVRLQKKYIDIREHRINYITSGNGEPLLLIHGANIGWGQWYLNIGQLSKKFKIFAIDLPGSGNSSSINYRLSDFNKDYVLLIEDFILKLGIEGLSVVAHSFAAAILLSVLLRKKIKIKKVVLVNPVGFTYSVPLSHKLLNFYPVARSLSLTVMKPTRKNMKNFLISVLKKSGDVTSEFIEYYYYQVKRNPRSHPFLFINSLMRNFRIKNELVLFNRLNEITVPILIIVGTGDRMMPKSIFNLSKILPNIKVELFDDSGHVPPLEESNKFNKTVLAFL